MFEDLQEKYNTKPEFRDEVASISRVGYIIIWVSLLLSKYLPFLIVFSILNLLLLMELALVDYLKQNYEKMLKEKENANKDEK